MMQRGRQVKELPIPADPLEFRAQRASVNLILRKGKQKFISLRRKEEMKCRLVEKEDITEFRGVQINM